MKTDICKIDSEGRLVSEAFGDIYYAPEDGYAESMHVFIEANDLPMRFKEATDFSIAEAGFGTGLNFLCALRVWDKFSSTGTLFYTAYELHPLEKEFLRSLYCDIPEIGSYADEFLTKYDLSKCKDGLLEIDFKEYRVVLRLYVGDINATISRVNFPVDAWFLDGFAPSCNELMWSEKVFSEVSRLAKSGATATTYSCARAVRAGFEANSFSIEKIPGFGRKKHMLRGIKN